MGTQSQAADPERVLPSKEALAEASSGHEPYSPASSSRQCADESRDDGDSDAASIGGQRNAMSRRHLLVAFPTLATCLFVSFIDQTSVSTAIPRISDELDTGAASAWISASFLIASTAFQLINGRLSDLFGRKNMLMACLTMMGLGDLLCGFARSKIQLFVFRAIAGAGGGGVNSLVMIIVSDITTLQNRGYYQGILGTVNALANGVGPFVGGAIVDGTTWRWVFWMVPMLALPAGIVILVFLPLRHRPGQYLDKIKKIDYGGIALNLAAVLLLLIPLSGGGVTYAWSSPFLVGGVAAGAVLAALFVLYEWKAARVPIMPPRLFAAPHCACLYAQSFFLGLCFFGNLFYLPVYLQSVRQYSALASGALILPLVVPTSALSACSGQFMARVGRYMPLIVAGFVLWTLANGLTVLFGRDTPLWQVAVTLVIEGTGIGMTLQPTLVGMYANSRPEDRAVVTGLRNFARTIGGAFGVVGSGVMLSNTLSARLAGKGVIPDSVIPELSSSAYALKSLDLTPGDEQLVLGAYMEGLRYIFIFYTACTAACLLMAMGIGNTNLKAASSEKSKAASRQGQEQDSDGSSSESR